MASYTKVKEAFADAQNYMTPKQEPILWDLAVGLLRLTNALEADLADVRSQLDDLKRKIGRMQ